MGQGLHKQQNVDSSVRGSDSPAGRKEQKQMNDMEIKGKAGAIKERNRRIRERYDELMAIDGAQKTRVMATVGEEYGIYSLTTMYRILGEKEADHDDGQQA